MTVRRATRDDLPELSRVMARAFYDDPLFSWIFPNASTRLVRMTKMNDAFFPRMFGVPFIEMYTTDDLAGVALWAGPEKWEPPSSAFIPAVPRLLRAMGVGGTRRMTSTMNALAKVHPHETHWYLAGLATDPPKQGRGVGSALVNEVTTGRCDEQHLMSYLETQKPENVPFYEKLGYQVVKELDLPLGGPHMWCMRREHH